MKRWSVEARAGGLKFTLLKINPTRWRVVGNASSGARRKVRFGAAYELLQYCAYGAHTGFEYGHISRNDCTTWIAQSGS